jgi:hypothetical protein
MVHATQAHIESLAAEDQVLPFEDQPFETQTGPLPLKQRNLTIVNMLGSPSKPSPASPTAYPPRQAQPSKSVPPGSPTAAASRGSNSLLPPSLAQDVSPRIS